MHSASKSHARNYGGMLRIRMGVVGIVHSSVIPTVLRGKENDGRIKQSGRDTEEKSRRKKYKATKTKDVICKILCLIRIRFRNSEIVKLIPYSFTQVTPIRS